MLDNGTVVCTPLSDHLVGFEYPRLDPQDLERALTVPKFSAQLDESVWLWPHCRNRDYAEHVQLISIPSGDAWFHDLWFPGYAWADTPNRWQVPGLQPTGGSNEWTLDNEQLRARVDELQRAESGVGRWVLADQLTPFSSVAGRNFPVVLAFLGDGGLPQPSRLSPGQVGSMLAGLFEGS